jgi:hypothetical protein
MVPLEAPLSNSWSSEKKVRASTLLFGPRRSAPHRGASLVLFVGPRRSAQHRGSSLVLFMRLRLTAA